MIEKANPNNRLSLTKIDFEYNYKMEIRIASSYLHLSNGNNQNFNSLLSSPIRIIICPEGQYESPVESEGCTKCQFGYFQSKIGKRSCDECSHPFSKSIGSISINDCLAPPGYLLISNGNYESCPDLSDGCSNPGTQKKI